MSTEPPVDADRPDASATGSGWWSRLRYLTWLVWRALLHFFADDGLTLAGSIAFASLFALFPFLIFLTTLASEFGQDQAAREFVELGLGRLPDEVSAAIRVPIDEVLAGRRTGLMTISIVTALWVASSGIEALRTAANLAYGITEPRAFWVRRIQSLVLTVLFSIGILLVMLMMIAAPFVWSHLGALIDIPTLWRWLYRIVRYVLAMGTFYLIIALLYRVLPNRRVTALEVFPGAAVAVLLWIGLVSLFSIYLQNLGRFTVTYGSLGGMVVTLLFFYVSAAIFIFGAEVNGAHRRAQATAPTVDRGDLAKGPNPD